MEVWVVLFVCYVVYLLIKRLDWDSRESGDMAPARSVRASTAKLPEPSAAQTIVRWQIDYTDASGNRTRRVIKITAVRPRLGQLEAWCELRRERRNFRIDRIERAVDAESGEIVEMEAWLKSYALSRRKAKPAS